MLIYDVDANVLLPIIEYSDGLLLYHIWLSRKVQRLVWLDVGQQAVVHWGFAVAA